MIENINLSARVVDKFNLLHNFVKDNFFTCNHKENLFRISFLPTDINFYTIKFCHYIFNNDYAPDEYFIEKNIINNQLQLLQDEYYYELMQQNNLKHHFLNLSKSTHFNFYPSKISIKYDLKYKKFLLFGNRINEISRMGSHIDNSTFTLVHQSSPGLEIIDRNKKVMSNLILFDSKLPHRIFITKNERFSISTFLYNK